MLNLKIAKEENLIRTYVYGLVFPPPLSSASYWNWASYKSYIKKLSFLIEI